MISEFREVITSRRSVRVFDGSPIPPGVVNECLDWALLAPNSSNLQAWEFIWVRTPEKRQELARICLGQTAAKTAAELVVFVARLDRWREVAREMVQLFENSNPKPPQGVINYYKRIVPAVYSLGYFRLGAIARHIFTSIVGLSKPIPREPVSRADLVTWAVKSCALATENFMLGMRAHGFDTCPMEGYDSKRLRRLLDLPKDAIPVMVIGCGKRAENGVYGAQIRFARERFVREV